ncbi:MAG TPA: flagellar basal body rod protein FlgB [Desulfotomaculum sp.]|nr:MAG: hypothetical protein JL56_05050 [Desulfotomaculum sp. BICA1-6]HBX23709.1 flagellar basal body rod protein FlgB [Desulfotomaculum sp.]
MDACTTQQRVIANNIANVNTPGFKKSTVNFQQQLQAALGNSSLGMKATNKRHLAGGGLNGLGGLAPQIVKVDNTSMKAGQNNVDVDEEMVNLAANTLLYQFATRVKSDRANSLSYVIKGGR